MLDSRIFQLIDSALPIGGFVYSMGMESAIKSKTLRNEEELKSYLCTYADQLFSFEIPFLDAGYTHSTDEAAWKPIFEAYTAMLMNPALEKSSLTLGKNWLRLLGNVYPTSSMHTVRDRLTAVQLPLHYTLVFGMTMKALDFSLAETRNAFQFTTIRDQITALTRLGTVGPHGGQELLAYVLAHSNRRLQEYQAIPYQKAYKSAYLMEIVQLNHDTIYSKLFQN